MKYKTLFRTVLKLFGVYLCVQAGLSIASILTVTGIRELMQGSQTRWGSLVTPLALALIKTSVGMYLLFGGKWIADLAIPSNRPYCLECGYDLTGASSSRCPECDTPFRSRDVAPPRDS